MRMHTEKQHERETERERERERGRERGRERKRECVCARAYAGALSCDGARLVRSEG